MKQRILMISGDYLPEIGGVAAHVHHLARALRRRGADVTVFQPLPGECQRIEKDEIDGVPVLRGYWRPSAIKVRDISRRVRLAKAAEGIVADVGIVHQHDYRSSVMAARSLQRPGTRWIYTNHTSDFLAHSGIWYQRLLDRIAWRSVDAVIAPSTELAQVSERVLRRKACFIPNGVDLDLFPQRPAPPQTPEEFVILCPRRMDPKNGITYFCRALKMLPQPKHHVRWRVLLTGRVTGDGPHQDYGREVLALLEDLPPWVEVELLGAVEPALMPRVFARAHLVVMPSLVEAISLSALEAMASGVPVLATNVGGLGELIDDERTGVLVRPRDPEAIARAAVRLEGDPAAASVLSAAARSCVEEHYGWDIVAAETMKVYGLTTCASSS